MRLAGSETLTYGLAAINRAGRLRVLAYHDVSDPAAFARHVEHLVACWTPVTGAQVARAGRGDESLPRRAVWVTFDDGYPGVVTHALPLLQRHGVPATLFVCPGYIDTTDAFWWEIVEGAAALGLVHDVEGRPWTATQALSTAKCMPDPQRRAFVERLTEGLASTDPDAVTRSQLTTQDLRTWTEAGLELENHTWDHPCLDRCSPTEQDRQIRVAHRWLAQRFSPAPRALAYPNGNATPVAKETLRELGYRTALGFDHRLAKATGEPLRLSRLRVEAIADLDRFRAIVSGVHAAGYRMSPRAHAALERRRRM
jgi:peptidoglycan/xylan/chitin deacetylase (PgdA/CDA1 family)